MKKISLVLSIFILLFFITGIGQNSSDPPDPHRMGFELNHNYPNPLSNNFIPSPTPSCGYSVSFPFPSVWNMATCYLLGIASVVPNFIMPPGCEDGGPNCPPIPASCPADASAFWNSNFPLGCFGLQIADHSFAYYSPPLISGAFDAQITLSLAGFPVDSWALYFSFYNWVGYECCVIYDY